MDTSELKQIQATLKEKYKMDPASAFITLKAVGQPGEGITCKIETAETKERLQTLIKLTERYCVVYQTLRKANQIEFNF